ncbi:MAG: ribosome maturation factor RimP [Bacteroidota bacterium]
MRGDTSPLFSLGKMGVENVEELVTTMLEQEVLNDLPEVFVVNVAYKGNQGSGKLLVEIDGDRGLGIDQIGATSRKLGKLLEEKDPIKGKYILEVTSPGADKPLKLLRQYHKHIGRRLQVVQSDETEVEGKLLEVSNDSIRLEVRQSKELEPVVLAFDEIKKSKVIVSFK